MSTDRIELTLAEDTTIYDEERKIAAMDLFITMWSPAAARDSRLVKRQALHARGHNVPVLVVLVEGAPALPSWLTGAPTISYAAATRLLKLNPDALEGAVLGPWEGA